MALMDGAAAARFANSLLRPNGINDDSAMLGFFCKRTLALCISGASRGDKSVCAEQRAASGHRTGRKSGLNHSRTFCVGLQCRIRAHQCIHNSLAAMATRRTGSHHDARRISGDYRSRILCQIPKNDRTSPRCSGGQLRNGAYLHSAASLIEPHVSNKGSA